LGYLPQADTGNLHGAVEFTQAAKDADIKPILGTELKVGDKALLLYVESKAGYGNLCTLLSRHARRLSSDGTAMKQWQLNRAGHRQPCQLLTDPCYG
jgi:DNA polymerase III alpha subunit